MSERTELEQRADGWRLTPADIGGATVIPVYRDGPRGISALRWDSKRWRWNEEGSVVHFGAKGESLSMSDSATLDRALDTVELPDGVSVFVAPGMGSPLSGFNLGGHQRVFPCANPKTGGPIDGLYLCYLVKGNVIHPVQFDFSGRVEGNKLSESDIKERLLVEANSFPAASVASTA